MVFTFSLDVNSFGNWRHGLHMLNLCSAFCPILLSFWSSVVILLFVQHVLLCYFRTWQAATRVLTLTVRSEEERCVPITLRLPFTRTSAFTWVNE